MNYRFGTRTRGINLICNCSDAVSTEMDVVHSGYMFAKDMYHFHCPECDAWTTLEIHEEAEE